MKTAEQLAAELNVNKPTLMEWCRRYSWPHTRIGRKFYFTDAQVAEIAKAHAVAGPKAATPVVGQTARSASRRRAS